MTDRGQLVQFPALKCNHLVDCYALEPTPEVCVKCSAAELRVLRNVVRDIRFALGRVDDMPSLDDLDEWMDESGVLSSTMRADLRSIADRCDDVRASMDSAEVLANRTSAKYDS